MKKILVVDDETAICEMLALRLQKNHYRVFTASSGKEALALAKSNPPDLILLDIAMPQMDGYALAACLRKIKATSTTPIIFLTAKELEPKSINERTADLSASGFLMKPFEPEQLLSTIKQALG